MPFEFLSNTKMPMFMVISFAMRHAERATRPAKLAGVLRTAIGPCQFGGATRRAQYRCAALSHYPRQTSPTTRAPTATVGKRIGKGFHETPRSWLQKMLPLSVPA